MLRECMEFAERTSIDVIGNYIDRAFSAKSDHRPEFQRMTATNTPSIALSCGSWTGSHATATTARTTKLYYAKTALKSSPQWRAFRKARKAYS